MFSRNAFWVCPNRNTFFPLLYGSSWMHGWETESAKWDITHLPLYHIWISVVLWVRETCTAHWLSWEHALEGGRVASSPPNTCRLTLTTLKFSFQSSTWLLDPPAALAEKPVSQHCWATGKLFWKEWSIEGHLVWKHDHLLYLYTKTQKLKIRIFFISIVCRV